MSYVINKSDGTVLTTIIDGNVDQTTDLTLVGKNYTGFGEIINEDLVKLLENFASITPPEKPIVGQIWFDKSEVRLKVYTVNGWKSAGGPVVSGSQPLVLSTGDMWIDSRDNQLWFFDGSDFILAGPIWKKNQGKSGHEVETVLDSNRNEKTIMNLWIGGTKLGVFSPEAFTPLIPIQGFTSFVKGFNTNSLVGYIWQTTVSNSQALNNIPEQDFLRSNQNDETAGRLDIRSNEGLRLGATLTGQLRVEPVTNTIVLENLIPDGDFEVRTINSTGSNIALFVDSSKNSIGVFTANPTQKTDSLGVLQPTLDIAGTVRIQGDLYVDKETVNLSVENLRIEDKTLEIAYSNAPTDLLANGAGIVIKATVDKTILYNNSLQSFNISEHINIASGKSLYIGGVEVLNGNTLSSAITSAPGITSFGPQANMTIGDMYLENSTILVSAPNTDLELEVTGTANISLIGSPKITGLANPSSPQDAATKSYADDAGKNLPLSVSFISNGISPLNAGIVSFLTDIADPTYFVNGKQAFVHIQTISYSAPNVNVARSLKKFEIVSGTWAFISDLVSSI
jgi:hypothetical protein